MRHGNAHRKFNRRSNQRTALFQHLASALIKANVLGALKLLEQLLADGDKAKP